MGLFSHRGPLPTVFHKYSARLWWTLLALYGLTACGGTKAAMHSPAVALPPLQIGSSAFGAGEAIPQRLTCDGQDLSPPLAWSEPPAGTQSLALICEDPDAPGGTWVHWLVYNLPATVRSLPEGVPPSAEVAGGGMQGNNSWGHLGYGGPCPPRGSEHRYVFRLYALDAVLALEPGANRKALERALEGHILAEGQIVGRYGR